VFSGQLNIYLPLGRMEACQHVELTGGSGPVALGGGSYMTWKGDIGRMTRKKGIGLTTPLGGSDRMTGRDSSTPRLVGSVVEHRARRAWQAQRPSVAPRKRLWPSGVTHERLSLGLSCLRAAASSPLCGARVAELSCLHVVGRVARWPRVVMHEQLPLGLVYLRVDASSPLRRPYANWDFFTLCRHAAAYWCAVD
jgi:hypothetical protein